MSLDIRSATSRAPHCCWAPTVTCGAHLHHTRGENGLLPSLISNTVKHLVAQPLLSIFIKRQQQLMQDLSD